MIPGGTRPAKTWLGATELTRKIVDGLNAMRAAAQEMNKLSNVLKEKPMQSKGIHRVTANSRKGRSMISPGRDHDPDKLTAEQREWNRKVEERRAEKNTIRGKK